MTRSFANTAYNLFFRLVEKLRGKSYEEKLFFNRAIKDLFPMFQVLNFIAKMKLLV